ncbi:MAG: hypothetical protein K0R17_2252 [Rariglobus sp.]|jgi:hypothetical protein|nr:hypothetical protein [Microvirga sp.]MDF3058037.1 hypothetical protein [Rariglobus sp.]
MNAATRELFRHNLIAQLCANGAPMKPAALKIGARAGGFEPADQDLDAEIQYLIDKELVAPVDKAISPEMKRWRITAAGRDYAAQEGLA